LDNIRDGFKTYKDIKPILSNRGGLEKPRSLMYRIPIGRSA
jgi:hypothetical protein